MQGKKEALKTAKQIQQRPEGKARSLEMDWDYYGTHTHPA